ncbi:SETD4 [Symbiodinium necroappetens]|uniref:SETD4 protein n=1 Tax=Symbiodinium necroappetens TaxID=1628268 RepID=A0A812J2Z0_9DINO|nr:SETD4 [Symbiodinium necroappetens]
MEPPDSAIAAKVQSFKEWLKNSFSVDLEDLGVTLRCDQFGGIGVFACRRLGPGDLLGRIPLEAILHAGQVRKSSFGAKVLAVIPDIPGEELLWLYMIWGREEPELCGWYPYLQILPPSDPLSWYSDEESLQWLVGTPMLQEAQQAVADQVERHLNVVGRLQKADPAFFTSHRFSLEAWRWARSCYVSRAFDRLAFAMSCEWDSDGLCPLLDSMNHRNDAEVEARFDQNGARLQLPTGAVGYQVGDEVHHLYQRNCSNSSLLLHYGFASFKNPNDSIRELKFNLIPGTVSQRLSVLNTTMPELEASSAGDVVCIHLTQGLTLQTTELPLQLLRAASLLRSGRDFEERHASCMDKARVCNWLTSALCKMLDQMQAFSKGAGLGRFPAMVLLRRGRLGRFAFSERARQIQAARPTARVVVLPQSAASQAAAIYAITAYCILRKAAHVAEDSAEMALLAARMERRQQRETSAASGAESA